MRIIHTSDLHLKETGKRIFGDKELTQIINETIKRKAKALLIAGDLFDSPTPPKKVISFVKQEFKRLNDKEIFVFLIMGDSDKGSLNSISLGKNVKIFKGTKITSKKIECLTIYGASYSNGNPLKSFKIDKKKTLSIGLFHLDIRDISLKTLDDSGLDYLALGHYHDFTKIKSKVPCYYSGSPIKSLKYKKTRRRIHLINIRHYRTKLKSISL